MAIFRKLHVSFWDDAFVELLTPEEKYFYSFLLTNPLSSECGIYELTVKKICHYTGYNSETVEKLLKRFENDYEKILYDYETFEVCIVNRGKFLTRSGKPMIDLLHSELKKVKNKEFIKIASNNVERHDLRYVYDTYHDASTERGQEEEEEEEEEKKKKKEEDVVFPDRLKEGIEKTENNPLPEKVSSLAMEIADFLEVPSPTINLSLPFREIRCFVENIYKWGKFDFLQKQFKDYKMAKATGEYKHGYKRFIGTFDAKYEDGAWCEKKYNSEKTVKTQLKRYS